MSSPINTNQQNNPYSQDVRTLAKAQDKNELGSTGQQVSTIAPDKKIGSGEESFAVTQKKQLNAAIIESTLEFSNLVVNKPLSLALKAALQGINEALQANGVESKVEEAYKSGVDFSPEATAERIVSFSTQFLDAFRTQNPTMDEEESLTAFMEVISSGIDQGFGEAKEILGGLNVLEGDVGTEIDKTYTLVQEGLQAFVDSLSQDKPIEEALQ